MFQYIHAIERTKLVANNYVRGKVMGQYVNANLDSNWQRMERVVQKFTLVSVATVAVNKYAKRVVTKLSANVILDLFSKKMESVARKV